MLAYFRSGATSARVMLTKLLMTLGSRTSPRAMASSCATASFILPLLYFDMVFKFLSFYGNDAVLTPFLSLFCENNVAPTPFSL